MRSTLSVLLALWACEAGGAWQEHPREPKCGDGVLDANEECDPSAEGWAESCDSACKRTIYNHCYVEEGACTKLNQLCAAYVPEPESRFCADYCEHDSECTGLPGFRAQCNFAWCVVVCDDGQCPNGMRCVPNMVLLDHEGDTRGTEAVCVNE